MVVKISVVLATRNRASTLRTTLEAMARVRRGPDPVEFVVVDNGSVDETARVLKEATKYLPLRMLWAGVAGKSHALNAALERGNLGDIVVFTDDDVTPDEDWFEAILGVCGRWPKHSVFGGRVNPSWPDGQLPPAWSHDNFLQSFAFARHVVSDSEGEYPKNITPFGPNYWVRRPAIEGMRFKNGLGPHPTKRRLGGETEFLLRLRNKGFEPVYSPESRVEHRIESVRLSKMAVYRRALQLGAGSVYTRWRPVETAAERAKLEWRLKRAWCVARELCALPLTAAALDERERVVRITYRLMSLGHELELLRHPSEISD